MQKQRALLILVWCCVFTWAPSVPVSPTLPYIQRTCSLWLFRDSKLNPSFCCDKQSSHALLVAVFLCIPGTVYLGRTPGAGALSGRVVTEASPGCARLLRSLSCTHQHQVTLIFHCPVSLPVVCIDRLLNLFLFNECEISPCF